MANTTAFVRYFPDLALPDTIYSNILNFGPYQYVAVVTGQGAALDTIQFIYKANMTSIGWTGLTLTPSILASSLLGVFEDDKLHYFSFIDIDGNQDANFHSYYLELDRCNERDGTDPTLCLRCIPPFYRDTVDPGNICLHAPYFPPGMGRNIPLNVLTSCQQAPLCLSCVYNFSECTFCDISNPWYLAFRDDKQCYTQAEVQAFPGYWGFKVNNGNNGTCARCSAGCIDCTSDHDFCVLCDSPTYFLDSARGVCYTDLTAPVGLGRDTSTDLATSCSVTNCSNCSTTYTVCKSCRVDQNSFFNSSTGLCYYYTSLANGYGGNRATSNIETCTDSGCLDCKYDKSVCVKCNTATTYFMNTVTIVCTLASNIVAGSGGSLVSGNIEPCTVSGCNNCRSDNTVCQACDMSLNLFLDFQAQVCVLKGNIAPGRGPNLQTSMILTCQDANCVLCPDDYSVCQFCKVAAFYMLKGVSCMSADLASPGTGLDNITSRNLDCKSDGCLDCRRDITVCLRCDETKGYFLEGGACTYTTGNLRIQLNPSKSQLVDISFIVTATLTDNSADMSELLQSLRRNLKISQKFSSILTNEEVLIPDSMKLSYAQKWLVVDTKLGSSVSDTNIQLELSTPVVSVVPRLYDATKTFNIGGFTNITVDMRDYLQAVALAQAQSDGQLVGGFVNFGDSSSATGLTQTAVIAAASIDPTGTLMKFNQILKIINKLYFININYGKRLDAFLKSVGTDSKKSTSNEIDNFWRMSRSSEGKLSREFVELDAFKILGWKAWVFLMAKFLSILASLSMYYFKIPKILIHCIHYCKKLDVIILNLFFTDLIWYCIHSLLHARNLPMVTFGGSFFCLAFISLDVYHNLQLGMSDEAWVYRIRQIWRSRHTIGISAVVPDKQPVLDMLRPSSPEPLKTEFEKQKCKDSKESEKSENDDQAQEKVPATSSRAINYPGYHSILDLHKDAQKKKASKKKSAKRHLVPQPFSASMRHIIDKRSLELEASAKPNSATLLTVLNSKGKQSPGSVRVISTKSPAHEVAPPPTSLADLKPLKLALQPPKPTSKTSSAEQPGQPNRNTNARADDTDSKQPVHYRHTRQHLLVEAMHLQQLVSGMLRPHEEAYTSKLARLHYLMHFSRIAAYQFTVVACQYASGLGIVVLLAFETAKLAFY